LTFVGLEISFAVRAGVNKKDTLDPKTAQQILQLLMKFDTEDAVRVTPHGLNILRSERAPFVTTPGRPLFYGDFTIV
jgi:hypothetical protein